MSQVEAADPTPPGKLLESPRTKIRLAVASGVIVMAGVHSKVSRTSRIGFGSTRCPWHLLGRRSRAFRVTFHM